MNLTHRELRVKLDMSEIDYVTYVIDSMEEHGLKFALFDVSDLDDIQGLPTLLGEEYECKIENDVFKIFWK